jgi:hypothetical protein
MPPQARWESKISGRGGWATGKADSLPDRRMARQSLGRHRRAGSEQPASHKKRKPEISLESEKQPPALRRMRAVPLIGGAQHERPGPAAAYPRGRLSHHLSAFLAASEKKRENCHGNGGLFAESSVRPGHSLFEEYR